MPPLPADLLTLAQAASTLPTSYSPTPSAGAFASFSPAYVLSLCALAAVGLGLLLPSRRDATLRRVGGAVLAVAGLAGVVLLLRQADRLQLVGPTGLYFWAFSAIAIVAAVRVITHPQPVYSALYFVMTVFASAGLFVLLWAQFMAAALVLIYAGAVLVTYVFVIMLAAESTGGTGSAAGLGDADRVSRDPFIAGAVGFALLAMLLMVIFDKASASTYARPLPPAGTEQPDVAGPAPRYGAFKTSPAVVGDPQKLGAYLYQEQMVPVQLAMLILTLSMTGAVIIARRRVLSTPGVATTPDVLTGPATPTDDNPHTIPVYGTDDPRAKEYPQT